MSDSAILTVAGVAERESPTGPEAAARSSAADNVITNAASTGIRIDRRRLKSLARRSDIPGLTCLAMWIAAMAATGALVWLALDTLWVWPAMFVFGVVMSVPSYSLSHETAHGTAFRTRWLNETVFWVTSLLYGEEPLHRRYTHTNHHTHTRHTCCRVLGSRYGPVVRQCAPISWNPPKFNNP